MSRENDSDTSSQAAKATGKPSSPIDTRLAAISTGSIAGLADGSGNHLLALTGIGFVSGSTVQWNGVNLATTYLGPWQLSAVVTSSEYGALPATVTVTNASGASAGFVLQ
jgi:hypothetical protein